MKRTILISLSLIMAFALFKGCEEDFTETVNPSKELKKGKPIKDPQPAYPLAENATQLQVYGVWHAGNDYCTWADVRSAGEFDQTNHWIIDRGDGIPSVNLVVLSFVNPLTLMNADPENPLTGIPPAMTQEIVNYFKNAGIRVMLSIGGFTYVDYWDAALAADPAKLARNAAAVASELGVGIEIDYEKNTDPNLTGLQTFIETYRSIHPYDATGNNHAARLTIDLAAGDRWLIALCQHASANWLTVQNPVLDYANAMVPARQPGSAGDAIANWYEHIEGKPQYAPPIPSIAPRKFTGSLYITNRKQIPECVDFYLSLQYAAREFVTRVLPFEGSGQGTTAGMLGYMFWAAECPSTRAVCATDCTGGIGEGAVYFNIPIPMPGLRQE